LFSKGGGSYKSREGERLTKILKSVLIGFAQLHTCSSSKDSYQKLEGLSPLPLASPSLLVIRDKKYIYM